MFGGMFIPSFFYFLAVRELKRSARRPFIHRSCLSCAKSCYISATLLFLLKASLPVKTLLPVKWLLLHAV